MRDKYYFFSDVHLGLYPPEKSREREKKIVKWLDTIKSDALEVFMVGDIFDFWHEHKHVVPKGFVRFFGKISELIDLGVKVHFFTGNHDIWAYGYFTEELDIPIYRKPIERLLGGKRFLIGHGDGVGPGDRAYKLLKWAFTNKFLQWWFSRLHPNFSMWIGKTWSKNSRYSKGIIAEGFLGADREHQVLYANETIKTENFDYFVFGHRHLPYKILLENGSSYIINLGDWIYSFTYGVFDGENFEVKAFENSKAQILGPTV